MNKLTEIEWAGESGWNPDVGNVEKGKRYLVSLELANELVKQGRAKIIKSKSDKGGK